MITRNTERPKWKIRYLGLTDKLVRLSGMAIALSGAAHFATPRLFVAISKSLFPNDTEKWVAINGASEAAIGLAIIERRTRPVGAVALGAYSIYLGDRLIADVQRRHRSTRH
ncbi:hypothetical protein L5G32_15530 [Gordonia sp. HY002]|uniref:hypothetical protein n=1 Tax=Gordonia zhenghanii TaxID=2911516 RepID=UPI001EF14D7F|nr:hypothetical protein [Gordonia zhenghanii]MCF8571682.1 hypothetical protein [Gordonia zhenghanii]MCF8602705.1 hypothetical protein [Gordonia zhenghanii]